MAHGLNNIRIQSFSKIWSETKALYEYACTVYTVLCAIIPRTIGVYVPVDGSRLIKFFSWSQRHRHVTGIAIQRHPVCTQKYYTVVWCPTQPGHPSVRMAKWVPAKAGDVDRHTARCTVLQCKLVFCWGPRKCRSVPLCKPYGLGKKLCFSRLRGPKTQATFSCHKRIKQ